MVLQIVILLHKLLAQKVKRGKLFAYMAPDGESFRGINAVRLLSKGKKHLRQSNCRWI
jgi:hypothetical protein